MLSYQCESDISFLMRQGDSWTRRFLWKQNDSVVDLDDVDRAVFTVKDLRTDDIVLIASSEDDRSVKIRGDLGAVDVYVKSTQTLDLTPNIYFADLELTFMDGTVQSTPIFMIRVIEDASQAASTVEPYRAYTKRSYV